jgi:glutamate carboxypeptidase
MTLSTIEKQLCDGIRARERELLDDLRLHVGLPTGGNNAAALDETRRLLTDRLRVLGATVETVPGDPKPNWLYGVEASSSIPPVAVCRRTARDQTKDRIAFIVSGHLDTVHDPQGPFQRLELAKDGKTATGPGCVDMKGGLVIAIAALEALAAAGIDADWTVVLNSDEETGSYHSERALRAEAKRILDRTGGAAGSLRAVGLVLEPALPDGSLVVERLGSGQFMIEARGRAAHVGRDFDKGVSAVTALARAIVGVGELPDVSRGKIANIGPIQGGIATNVVPDHARAWGNVRYPDRAIMEELEAGIRALEVGGDAPVHVHASFNRPAKPFTPQVERIALAARDVAQDLGQKLPFGKTGGVCDGNILQDAGLPTIDTLGVRGGGLHTPQEWIELASLVERCQLLAVLMARLTSGAIAPQ